MADEINKSNERINRSVGQRVKKGQRDVARRYAQALNEIRDMLGKIYRQYETDGVLTFEEMAKFDRLQTAFQEIDFVLRRNYRDMYDMVYDVLGFTYGESWDLTAWAIETEAKASLGYSVASSAAVTAAIEAPIDKLTLSARLEKNRGAILAHIRNEMTIGLVQGETYRTMSERIKDALDGDATKAVRVIRTEAHRVQETSKLEAVQHADRQGVKMLKTWRSVQDSRVRHRPRDVADHKKLNGVTLQVDENFRGAKGKGPGPGQLGHPAEDINCRCFLTYSIDRVEDLPYNQHETVSFDNWRQARR